MKKSNKDSQKTAELLKKLQETVLSSHKREKQKPEPEPDRDELEFQNKIAGMLSKFTEQKPAVSKGEKSPPSPDRKKQDAPSAPSKISKKKEKLPTPSTSEEHLHEKKKLERDVPAFKDTVTEQSIAPPEPEDEPIVEEPVIEESVIEEPVIDEPVINEPVIDEPVIEEPVIEELVIEEPVIDEPVIEETVIEEPVIEETVIEEPVIEEPVIEEPVIEEPVIDEPVIEEPVIEEPVIEEPVIDEPVIEEPVIEEPVIEKPMIEKPMIKESVIDEPVIEEPIPSAQIQAENKKPLVVVVIPAKPPAEKPIKRPSDSIVITPKHSIRPSAPIVIKPSEPVRATEPTRVEVKNPMPNHIQKQSEPIRITPPSSNLSPKKAETGTNDAAASATAKSQAAVPLKRNPAQKRPLPGVTLPGAARPAGNRSGSMPRANAPIRPNAPVKGKAPLKKNPHHPDYHHSHENTPEDGFDIALEAVASEEPLQEELTVNEEAHAEGAYAERAPRKPSVPVGEMTIDALLQYVERRTGMNRDDLAMVMALGYDHELSRLIGRDALKRLKIEFTQQARPTDPRAFRTAFGYRNREYTGEQSRELILANYTRDKKRLILRIAVTALMLLLLLPSELAPLLGGALAQYRAAIPPLFPLLSLVFLLTAGGFSLKQLGAGITDFFRMSPSPYSVAGLLFPLAVLVGVLNIFLTGSGRELTSLHLPAASALLVTALCDGLRLISEMRVFRILSAEADKLVIEPEIPTKQKLRHGDKIVKIINDDVDHNLYRLRRSLRVSGFFRRCNDLSTAEKPFGYLTVTALLLTFPVGLLCSIRGGSLGEVFSAALLTLAFAFPIPAVLLYFYPLCRVNRQLTHRNCALIGEESVAEFTKQKTVILQDSDMYSVKKRTQTMLRNGEDFKRDMRLAEALFRKINGQDASPTTSPVALVRIVENGTEAVVDNHHHLLAGSAEFLTKSGVRIPKESTDRALGRDAGTAVMYVAIDGVLRLIYEIEYTISPGFEQLVADLAEHNAYAAIRTCDPNINETFLLNDRGNQADFVRVMKQASRDTDTPSELSDCGAVALGSRLDAVAPVIAAVKIQRLRSFGYRCLLLCSALGAAAAAGLSLSASAPLPGVALLMSLLFQSITTGAVWLISHLLLRLGSAEQSK